MIGKRARTALAATVVLAVFAMAPAASAGTAVIREGSCSGTSDWKLKLNPGDGAIEVEFEVDSNVAGQHWRVRIFQNGDRIFSHGKTTHGASGSFTARVVADDPAGTDRFRGRAKQPASGESCVGHAQI